MIESLADSYEPEEESPPSSKKEADAASALVPMMKAFKQALDKGDFKKAAAVMAEVHMTCDQYMEEENEEE